MGNTPPQEKKATQIPPVGNTKVERKSHLKVLLLGASQAGKTTIFKQFVYHFKNDFTKRQREQYIGVIYENVVSGAKGLLKWAEHLELRLNPETEESAQFVRKMNVHELQTGKTLRDKEAAHLRRLWEDGAIQEANFKLDKSQLMECVGYYLNRIDLIAREDYLPSVPDILHARLKTTGVVETHCELPGAKILLFDVGGERSERKKWIHCFDDVDVIIYPCAISEYNRTLLEDDSTNRIMEHVEVFDKVINSKLFDKTLFILLFTKRDIYEKNFDKNVLKANFPAFDGSTIEDGYKFFEELFKSQSMLGREIALVERLNAVDLDDFLAVMEPIKKIFSEKFAALHLNENE
eukprot:TRINITY_DN14258_c0_g3_i1.p1 TRINITY_DN14258_c0_g3~~TRINITY_DN14258_c0_g3_i1.p1  ORF type:complete len:372 (-),score=78.95 TRINITY_DN14258_c0_g3_i1:26-1075(-)